MHKLHASGFAQAGGKVWLERSHGHSAVFAGIHAVARMRAAHRTFGGGHAQLAGQGQPGRGIRQGNLVA